MRLQLTSWWWLSGAAALAGDRVSTRVDVYRDGWITAWVPQVRAERGGERWSASGGYAVDAVSGATLTLGPDVISSATRFVDARHQVDLGVTHTFGNAAVGASFAASSESDYLTRAPALSASAEVFDRTATLSARWSPSFETLGSAATDRVHEQTVGQGLDLGWTQILDRRTTVAFAASGGWWSCGEAFGCQASPYRYVAGVVDGRRVSAALEHHPDTRGRLAGNLRISRSFGSVALHWEYGLYADTWSVSGQVAKLSVAGEAFRERLLLRGELRGAAQSAASFYRDRYRVDAQDAGLPAWRTGDLELGGVRDASVGLRPEWSFYDVGPLLRLGVGAKVTAIAFRTPGAGPDRNAWIVGGGLDAEF